MLMKLTPSNALKILFFPDKNKNEWNNNIDNNKEIECALDV